MSQNVPDVDAECAKAARELTEVVDELREAHGEAVAEFPSMTVFADTTGHELAEIAEVHNDRHGTDLSRSDVASWMHRQAKGVDRTWSVSDPVVVLHD
jgi:hypothetical protein